MSRTLSRIRKDPDRVRAYVRAICTSEQIKDKSKGTVFVGKGTFTAAQLDYMIQCAKEARERKTW